MLVKSYNLFQNETNLNIACCELGFMKDGIQGKVMLEYVNQLAAKKGNQCNLTEYILLLNFQVCFDSSERFQLFKVI